MEKQERQTDRQTEIHLVFAFRSFSKDPHDGNLVENLCLLYTGLGFVTKNFVLFQIF